MAVQMLLGNFGLVPLHAAFQKGKPYIAHVNVDAERSGSGRLGKITSLELALTVVDKPNTGKQVVSSFPSLTWIWISRGTA